MNPVKAAREYIKNVISSKALKRNKDKLVFFGKTGVNHIIFDKKIKNNVEQNEYSLRFYIDEKKPFHEIPQSDLIPSSIIYDGIEIKTDVDDEKLEFKKLTDCHQLLSFNLSSVQPIAANYIKRRPLMGGASSIYVGGTDATLGILFKDKDDGSIVAISNNHVYADEQIIASEIDFVLGDRANMLELSARQPGTNTNNPYGSLSYADDYIGKPKKASLMKFTSAITSDFTALELYSNTLIDTISSPNIINFVVPAPFLIASEDEIDSLLLPSSPNYGAPLFKSGRTTGPVGYPGTLSGCSFPCALGTGCNVLCATALFTGNVGFSIGSVPFTDCIRFKSAYQNFVPLRGGDSGSAMFALLSASNPSLSAWKFVGLAFAGTSPADTASGIFCRADNFMDQFNIIPWDREISNLKTRETLINVVSNVYINSETLILSGRKFYQQGIPNG